MPGCGLVRGLSCVSSTAVECACDAAAAAAAQSPAAARNMHSDRWALMCTCRVLTLGAASCGMHCYALVCDTRRVQGRSADRVKTESAGSAVCWAFCVGSPLVAECREHLCEVEGMYCRSLAAAAAAAAASAAHTESGLLSCGTEGRVVC